MFAVSSANSISITRSDIFCIPTFWRSHIGCPSSMDYRTRCDDLSLPTRGLGSLFFCPHTTDSIMANSLNPARREKQSTPSHTCPSHENARRNRLAAYRRLSRNFPIGAVHPEKLFMFAVHSINEERNTASSLRADFLYPNLNQYGYSTPSSSVNAPTALREWNAEGKAVPSLFYSPNKHNSVMHSTEKKVCSGSLVSPSDTCPSHENARLRLTFLRLTIMSWMETAIRSEFPHATKARYRIRKGRRGRCTFYASVRSHGVYLSFHSVTLDGLSEQIRTAAATHRLATGGATNNIQSLSL